MAKGGRVTRREKQAIWADKDAGRSEREIAALHNRCVPTIRRALRNKPTNAQERAAIRQDKKDGMRVPELMKKYRRSEPTIFRALAEKNEELAPAVAESALAPAQPVIKENPIAVHAAEEAGEMVAFSFGIERRLYGLINGIAGYIRMPPDPVANHFLHRGASDLLSPFLGSMPLRTANQVEERRQAGARGSHNV